MLHRNKDGKLIEISRPSFANDAIYHKQVYSAIAVRVENNRDKTENNKKRENALKA
jgi:hypothetical protein